METPETPPDRTPATGSYSPGQARIHARSIAETRRKIARVFEIPTDRLTLPPVMQERLAAGFANELCGNRWTDRRDNWRTQPLNAAQTTELDSLAQKAMLQYAEGFYLREQVIDSMRNHKLQGAEVNFFRKFPNNANTLDNHLTHIFHATQAKLEQATGGDAATALKMHGYLIERCISHCKARGITNARFQPDCRDLKTPEDCIDRLKHTSAGYANMLREDYAKANKTGELTHAARASRSKNENESPNRY